MGHLEIYVEMVDFQIKKSFCSRQYWMTFSWCKRWQFLWWLMYNRRLIVAEMAFGPSRHILRRNRNFGCSWCCRWLLPVDASVDSATGCNKWWVLSLVHSSWFCNKWLKKWSCIVVTGIRHGGIFDGLLIGLVVGGAITILKNDGVRHWEGWHPFFMKWKS